MYGAVQKSYPTLIHNLRCSLNLRSLRKEPSSLRSKRVCSVVACFSFCGSQSKSYSARRLNRGRNRKDGGGEKKGESS